MINIDGADLGDTFCINHLSLIIYHFSFIQYRDNLCEQRLPAVVFHFGSHFESHNPRSACSGAFRNAGREKRCGQVKAMARIVLGRTLCPPQKLDGKS